MSDDFTPLDCRWCYWENHVTTDESCICLHDACKTGDPERAFALACDYDDNCPCEDFEHVKGGAE